MATRGKLKHFNLHDDGFEFKGVKYKDSDIQHIFISNQHTIDRNRPFFSAEVAKEVDSLGIFCRFKAFGVLFHDMKHKESWEKAIANFARIQEQADNISTAIRKRLQDYDQANFLGGLPLNSSAS